VIDDLVIDQCWLVFCSWQTWLSVACDFYCFRNRNYQLFNYLLFMHSY